MAEVSLIIAGICLLLLCFLLTLVFLLTFSGLFETIEIGAGKPPIEDVVIAYKAARGPYKETGTLYNVLSLLAPPEGYKGISIYYDDPKVTAPKDLRYVVGAVLEEGDKVQDPEFRRKLLEEEGFKLFKIPSVSYAVKTEFPYKSSLSIYVAIARVYPKLEAYIKEHKLCAHPFLEICDGNKIKFMAPLARQGEFYVEEFQEKPSTESGDDTLEGSYVDDSMSHSETSATTYRGSVMGDESVSEIDVDESDTRLISSLDTVKEDSPSADGADDIQESGNDKQTEQRKDDGASDGNESGSSFEELRMDEQLGDSTDEKKDL